MPRQPRLIIPGLPHHIVQRGHNRQQVFQDDRDFQYYLSNLEEWKQALGLTVYSYCLMTNHVHLVVGVTDETATIPEFMKRLAGRQTRFTNQRRKRSGLIWEGRYKTSPIDSDAYLLGCCRYVELNPVKAGLVDEAERYPWSSYPARIGREISDWLDEPSAFTALADTPARRIACYRSFVSDTAESPADSVIREAIATNRVTGSAEVE
ncbi:transposase [Marinobacter profundi]|uniref:Transposase n=1 Tax=Marinobacter profundi TaxID=2666256 RepID=A0A2G1UJ30_9GAMM|nr:transposase [Marinobacter profundi]PHQ14430.1 transposase [Marinobacter profundi]